MPSKKPEVWFDSRKLCAEMPALILVGNEMEPMWRQEDATVDGDTVCINPWRSGWTVIRVGSGWGRRRGAHYYFVEFTNRAIIKVKRTPTKNIHTQNWMDCLSTPAGNICLEWRGGRLLRGPVKPV